MFVFVFVFDKHLKACEGLHEVVTKVVQRVELCLYVYFHFNLRLYLYLCLYLYLINTSRLARASTRSSPRLCGEMMRQRRWRNADTAIIENGNLLVLVIEMAMAMVTLTPNGNGNGEW